MKTITTVGRITRSITRAFHRYETRGGEIPNWMQITRRHFEKYAKRIGKPCKVSGPFGLCCEFSVTIGRRYRSFTMSNGDGWQIRLRNYRVNTGEFKPGTIGYINGMNHPETTIPNKTTLEDLFFG